MNNNKRTVIIVLLILGILTVAANMFSLSRSVFFDDLTMNGGSRIQLRVRTDYNLDDLKEVVQDTINKEIQKIEVNQETADIQIVLIEMDYLDAKEREEINNALLQLENKGVQLTMMESIGPINKEGKQWIYTLFGAMVIVLVTMFAALAFIVIRGKKLGTK